MEITVFCRPKESLAGTIDANNLGGNASCMNTVYKQRGVLLPVSYSVFLPNVYDFIPVLVDSYKENAKHSKFGK
jgi:hypothetical protein